MYDGFHAEKGGEKYRGMLVKPYYKEYESKRGKTRIWGAYIFCSFCGNMIKQITQRFNREEALAGAKEYIDGVRDGMKVINSGGGMTDESQ